MITIDDKTKNPITEHKIDILKRLPQDMKIGRGGAKRGNPWITNEKLCKRK
jgi:hypothetical protein